MAKSQVEKAAQDWRDAQHVATQVGGRAAAAEVERTRAALAQAAGTSRRR